MSDYLAAQAARDRIAKFQAEAAQYRRSEAAKAGQTASRPVRRWKFFPRLQPAPRS